MTILAIWNRINLQKKKNGLSRSWRACSSPDHHIPLAYPGDALAGECCTPSQLGIQMRWPFCPQGAVSCSSNLRFQVQTNQIVCFYCIKSYCTGAFGELGYTLPLRNIRSPQGLKSHFGLYSLWSKEKVVCDASDSSGKNFTVDRATSGDLPLVTEV